LRVPVRKRVGAGELTDETRASITVFEGWLQKEGYSESRYPNNLKTLVYLGADLMNPESVKEKLGAHPVKDGAKLQYVYAYEAYIKMLGLSWERPYYKQEETIPFIPEEGELDQLVAAARSRRMAAYLQCLKETFADPGEGLRIEWIDVSARSVKINHPVKGHRPRELEVSGKLIAMLNSLPHTSDRIFDTTYNIMCGSYVRLRRRVAEATKNERLNWIELRTFRHWGGTMIAQMTNGNVIIVMQLLGHKRVENSMKYINIFKLRFKQTEFEVASALTVDEAKAALAAGFVYSCEKSGVMLFTRPKRFSPAGMLFSKRESDLVNLYEKGSGDISRASPLFSVVFYCSLMTFLAVREVF
jgi:integrase